MWGQFNTLKKNLVLIKHIKRYVCACVCVCGCVCPCVSVCPLALCSCEDTLNGHSAHISHWSRYGPLKVIYFTHLLFTEQLSDCTRVSSAALSPAAPVFVSDTARQGEASYSAQHCDLHIAPRTLRSLHSVPCTWKHSEPVSLPLLLSDRNLTES